jgi:FtsP/CotA-like multicopper oxidase with cupredoxin domain
LNYGHRSLRAQVSAHASLRDTFSIPPATDSGSGVLKVVIPFTDLVIVGRFVFHCHAVDHEDKGMMGVVEVVER